MTASDVDKDYKSYLSNSKCQFQQFKALLRNSAMKNLKERGRKLKLSILVTRKYLKDEINQPECNLQKNLGWPVDSGIEISNELCDLCIRHVFIENGHEKLQCSKPGAQNVINT